MSEKLCIFCKHFNWTKESCWGMGSTMTGPMMEGGDATCSMGHYRNHPDGGSSFPDDDADFRRIILRGESCPDYARPDAVASPSDDATMTTTGAK